MPPETSRQPAPSRVEALIHELHRELGPELLKTVRPASQETKPAPCGNGSGRRDTRLRHPTGLEEIDALLGGGFPAGRLSEVSGPVSSGRTSLAFGLLARITRSGAHVAWVDLADAFDPPSAEAAGVVLERVLWVRAPRTLAALRCAERILETEGFVLVVLDLTGHGSPRSERNAESKSGRRNKKEAIPHAVWLRLTRLVAAKQNALVLLSDERLAGSRAAFALEMQPAIAHFAGTPPLLEGLEPRALLTRRSASPLADPHTARPTDPVPSNPGRTGIKARRTSSAA